MQYNYQDPNGNFATCVTNNPAHIAIMETALVEDCELEEPVDTHLPISDEDKAKLTKEEKDSLKILKKEYHGSLHTVLKKVPDFNPEVEVV